MPGPASDSYDPEFGTGQNAADVREAVERVRDLVSSVIGDPELRNIVDVVHEPYIDTPSPLKTARQMVLTENGWRVVRFALNRALESL